MMVESLERIRAPRAFFFDPACVLYLPLHRMEFGRSDELLSNCGMEIGDPPTGWTLSGAGASWARSNTQKYAGSYSGKLTRNGADCEAYQWYLGFAKYKGLSGILSCWVYAIVADRARIGISDGITTIQSSYHSGVAGWEGFTVTRVMSAAMANMRARLHLDTGDTSAYYDQASMYIPDLAMSSDHYGHPVQNSGAVWTYPYGYLFDGLTSVITIPDHASLQNIFDSPGGTIVFWINAASVGESNYGRIWDKNYHNCRLLTDSGSGTCKLLFRQNFSTISGQWTSTNHIITYGKPQMVSISYDNSSVDNDPIICIDGNPVAITETATPDGTRVTDADNPLCIGNLVATTYTFDGYIMEVWAFKGKLMYPRELQQLLMATRARYGR